MDLVCEECGRPLEGKRHVHGQKARFCNAKCRSRWNARRAQRGAELYDLVMTWRYDRSRYDDMQTVISNMARAYRDSDKAKRAGRRSWDPDSVQRLPAGYTDKGDGR